MHALPEAPPALGPSRITEKMDIKATGRSRSRNAAGSLDIGAEILTPAGSKGIKYLREDVVKNEKTLED